MFWQMIKKELLIIWRRPRELIVLLFMPFILITILGSALGALEEDQVTIHAKLAIVVHDDTEGAQKKILDEIEQSNAEEREKAGKIAMVQQFQPVDIFLKEVVDNPELKEVLTVTVFKEGELSQKQQEDFDGVLEIPNGFSEKFFHKLLNGEGQVPEWVVKTKDTNSFHANVIVDIVSSYQKEMTTAKTVYDLQLDYSKIMQGTQSGSIENVSKKKEISSFAYYAVGMCVMFVFYVSSHVAGCAYYQKEEHIYQRILLSNVPKGVFFAGIFVSTFLLSFLQLSILFTLTALIYDVTFPDIGSFLLITMTVNIMASGFATLIASISFAFNSKNVDGIVSSLVIPLLAFVGGSFFNLSAIGGFMETLGEYSPGGAAITAYLKAYQGYSLTEIWAQLQAILLITFILVIFSAIFIGKRGERS